MNKWFNIVGLLVSSAWSMHSEVQPSGASCLVAPVPSRVPQPVVCWPLCTFVAVPQGVGL